MKESCLIIAGEKSGEEHAETFLPQVIRAFPNMDFYGVGGNYFRELGIEVLYDLKDFSTFGYSEALIKIKFYLDARKKLIREVKKRKTKFAILIDFQSFNLSLAKKLKKQGVEILYYVAPQAWAWKEYRAKSLARATSSLYCILPFEKKWFGERGVHNIVTVKHPVYRQFRNQLTKASKGSKNILFLPGSRDSEVKFHLPVFAEVIELLKKTGYKFHIVKTQTVKPQFYEPYENLFDKIYTSTELEPALKNSLLAVASSGTVTLTCGLFGVPTIVCYQVSEFNKFINYTFINYDKFVSLPNVILNEEVFPELLGERFRAYYLLKKLKRFLETNRYDKVQNKLEELKAMFESAEDSAAPHMIEQMKKRLSE